MDTHDFSSGASSKYFEHETGIAGFVVISRDRKRVIAFKQSVYGFFVTESRLMIHV